MRIRSVIITAVAGLAFMGASATAAQAGGGIKQAPQTPPTTAKPCCKDMQTPPTTQKPKPNFEGPGDIKAPEKDPIVDPAPQPGPQDGPDDIADAPKDDNPKPQCGDCDGKGMIPPSNDGGSDSGKGGKGGNSGGSTDTTVAPTEDTTTTQVSEDLTDSTDLVAEKGADASNFGAFAMIFGALVVAALIGLVVARMRRDDEEAETV